MRKCVFSFVFLLLFGVIDAQYLVEAGARQGAMGGSGVILNDVWSAYHNQAGLAGLKGLSAGLYYSSVFNEPDLRETAFSFAFPTEKYGSAGVNYSYSGNSFSNFSRFGFAYSKQLGKRVSAGIQIDYFLFSQMNYGNTGVALGEVGLIAQPVDHLFVGAHVFNPWRATYNYIDESLETIFKLGAGYYFSDRVVFMVEAEKEIDHDLLVRAGMEYQLFKGLYLRAGAAFNPVKYSFGLGYNFKGIGIDLSYISHETLGYYMQFGLSFTIENKDDAGEKVDN